MQFSTLKSFRVAAALGFLTSLALGCVVTLGDGGKKTSGECPDVHSDLKDGECFCDSGYSWCDAFNDNDLTCCPNASDDSNTPSNDEASDPSNGTSDVPTDGGTSDSEGTTETPPTSGTTGDTPSNCVVETEVPASCDAEMGESYLCLSASDPACDVEGSKYYICEGGVWVEDNESGTESCKFDLDNDSAFAYGCKQTGNTVDFVCGVGSGAACNNGDDPSCSDETNIEYCYLGKLTSADCLYECQQVGDDEMVTYDYGYCGEQSEQTSCICCDEGDDGCPINGETSTTSESTTSESTTSESSSG